MMLEPDLSKHRQLSELTSKRVSTLKKRSDFLRLRSTKRYSAKSLVLQSGKAEAAQEPRVGYTVTKKVGNAVVRNRIRRRLREAVSKIFPLKARPNYDYVIIGKHGALTGTFTSLLKDVEQALDHVHKSEEKGHKKFSKSGDGVKSLPKEYKDTQ